MSIKKKGGRKMLTRDKEFFKNELELIRLILTDKNQADADKLQYISEVVQRLKDHFFLEEEF
jgi:hemerythrin